MDEFRSNLDTAKKRICELEYKSQKLFRTKHRENERENY